MGWVQVDPIDEYAQSDDTHCFITGHWAYYWNPVKRIVRRYGTLSQYEEYVSRRGRPDAAPGVCLRTYLAERFAYHRSRGNVYSEQL